LRHESLENIGFLGIIRIVLRRICGCRLGFLLRRVARSRLHGLRAECSDERTRETAGNEKRKENRPQDMNHSHGFIPHKIAELRVY